MRDSGIEILLSSDSRYEELTAEIFHDGKFVALLNKDTGVDNLKREFPSTNMDENMVLRKLDLASFEEGLALAKQEIRG